MNLKSEQKNDNSTKTALITGAAKRVGRSIAIALAENGWNLALHHNSTDISEVLYECQKLGAKTSVIKSDLNNFDELQKIIPNANAELGEISLLINNASIFEKCSFAETDESVFDRHMNINFKAPFFLSQAFAKQTQNGQIINLSDTRVSYNKTAYFAYLHSKKSLSDMTKMLAVELGPNIRVNEIALGACEMEQSYDKSYLEQRVQEIPLKKAVSLSDLTKTLIFMAQQSHFTGQRIFVDSGENLI